MLCFLGFHHWNKRETYMRSRHGELITTILFCTRCGKQRKDETMKEIQEIRFNEISIGDRFKTDVGEWLVTDKGTRVIIAVNMSVYTQQDVDLLAATEHVFNEDDYDSGEA